MNYLPLPLHNKSKSISFINSPKLWFQNFLSYLETNHKSLYDTIISCLMFIKTVFRCIVLVTCLYFVGYICTDKDVKDRAHEEIGIASHLVVATFGCGICFLLYIIYEILGWFICFMIQFSLQVYNTIIELLASLRAYNSSTNNKDGDL
jgi:hypothetical protein